MEFSPQQREALDAARRWLSDPSRQVFRLFGYAGTGKTTLAKHLVSKTDEPLAVLFAAYTGKAAHNMRRAGCQEATTLHSILYLVMEKSRQRLHAYRAQLLSLERDLDSGGAKDGLRQEISNCRRKIGAEERNLERPAWSLNPESDLKDADVLVVDECSMVDERMGKDILSFRKKVLVLGDPAQLPPIMGGGYFTEATPDAMLTEIHRQAEGDPIIRIATMARLGQRIPRGEYGDSRVVARGAFGAPDIDFSRQQVLVGLNETRRRINRVARRKLHGEAIGGLPIGGDRVICLRNDHEVGVLNGSTWFVEGVTAGKSKDYLNLHLRPDGEDGTLFVEAHVGPFLGEKVPDERRRHAQEFDYAYAVTVHKAQGSQWDSVVVVDESGAFARESRRRWLYTGITRARSELVLISPDSRREPSHVGEEAPAEAAN